MTKKGRGKGVRGGGRFGELAIHVTIDKSCTINEHCTIHGQPLLNLN